MLAHHINVNGHRINEEDGRDSAMLCLSKVVIREGLLPP